jgi:MFS family permease
MNFTARSDIAATPGNRRWSLAAVISAVTVFGVTIGLAGPLMSLTLEGRGVEATLNGLNAGTAFIGVILGPLLTPLGVRVFGLRNFLLSCFAIDFAVFPMMHVFDSVAAWFILRVMLGMVGASIFAASEAWITILAGNAARGRITGIYAASLSAGFACGPLVLSLTGIEGWSPFIVGSAITALASVPLLAVGTSVNDLGRGRGRSPLRMFAKAPLLLLAVAMFGLYEQSLLALLPVWGVRIGLSRTVAATSLSAIFIGAIMLQWPFGLLSDRVDRLTALRTCGAIALCGAILLATMMLPTPALFCLLFVWGGSAAAIYPVALSMAGDRFQGSEMMAFNAAIIIAYGLGSLIGPTLGGLAIDLGGPNGLPDLFILLFAAFLLATLSAPRSGRRPVALKVSPPAKAGDP